MAAPSHEPSGSGRPLPVGPVVGPLIRRLQQEVPRLGFTPVTPPDSTGGNVSFARKGLATSDLPRRLASARVNVRLGRDWMRLSPSVYNDLNDVERFLEAIA